MSGIIVGIDGSAHSERALEWAVHEAAVRQLPLRVLTVYRRVAAYWGGANAAIAGGVLSADGSLDESLADSARTVAREATEKALALAGDAQPASVTVEAVPGVAAEELDDASKGADMIVLGSRGAGGFARLLLGSVTTHAVHHAHCPVVVIPAEDRH